MTVERDRGAIEDRLRRILCDLLLLRSEEVKPESLLVEELDIDSIALLELAFTIEQEFGVEFPDVKASEEMFAAPLPDALAKLEAMPGGTTFFEYVKLEAMDGMTNGDFGRLRADALATAVDGRLPIGIAAERPLIELRLADLFRFLTVRTLAGYVGYLIETRDATP